MLTAEDYRDIRNLVLHQGRTRTERGRFYKFTKPTPRGGRIRRFIYDSDVFVFDVGELPKEIVAGIRSWFLDLQRPEARERQANVAKHLPSLVTVKEQELSGIRGVTLNVTHTSTGP